MVKLKLWKLVFTIHQIICASTASTHWIVTENGLIQPMLDSLFHMRFPHDLMKFLEQDDRMTEIDSLYHDLVRRKLVIDEASLVKPQDIASKLYETNDNCLKSGVAMEDIDLYMSVAADGSDRDGIKLVDFFADNSLRNADGANIPDCTKITPLPFSMFAFEHLKAMLDRDNMSLPAESSLSEWLLPGTSVTSFGHQVYEGLKRNSTSWLHYNLAAIFWRIKGEAFNAIECGRRASHFAPREYRDVALLNLASIFHQTRNPTEAVIILHAAIDHAPRQPANHFALGNVYAVLEDYNKSVIYYDNCLKLMPSFKQAKINKYSVLCHEQYVNELMQLYKSIQVKQTELRDFQIQHEKWLILEDKALQEAAPLETRMQDMSPDDINGHTCIERSVEDSTDPVLTCQLSDPSHVSHSYGVQEKNRMEKITPLSIMHSIQVLLKNVEAETKKLSKQIAKTDKFHHAKQAADINFSKFMSQKIQDSSDFGELDDKILGDSSQLPSSLYFNDASDENDFSDLPKSEPKYPVNMKVSRIKQDFDRSSEWPSREECDDWSPTLAKHVDKQGEALEQLPIYLPIENKGYNVSFILSEKIDVPLNEEHPLPWYPPICCTASKLAIRSTYLPSAMLANSKPLPNDAPNNVLRNILVSYVTHSQVDPKHSIQEAEIGQRILTAINKKAAPKWLLYALSSLYWRVRGNTQNSLDCLLCGLSKAPKLYKDLLLVSLGSVLKQLGHIDESLKVTTDALVINKNEPSTNFLMSMLYKSKKNINGQMYYIKQVVRIDPDFMNGWAMTLLKAWHCQAKFVNQMDGENQVSINELPEMCSDIALDHGKEFRSSGVPGESLTLSKDGGVIGRGMICTAGGTSCQPANIHCYKAPTQAELGEEYLPFDLVSDTAQQESDGDEVMFQSLLSKMEKNIMSGKEIDSLVFKTEDVITMPDLDSPSEHPGRVKYQQKVSLVKMISSHQETCTPTARKEGKCEPQLLSLNLNLKDSNKNNQMHVTKDGVDHIVKDPNKHFQITLAPNDVDLGTADEELGNLMVATNEKNSKETLHVYDKTVSYHLSGETCGHKTRPDLIKSPSFWNLYTQRDFFPSNDLLSVAKMSVKDPKLRPLCTAPSGDIVEQSILGKFPPLPHQSTPSLLPILRRLTNDNDSPLNILAAKIAEAIKHNASSWVLHVLAGIYWRIEGNSNMLVSCLRQSLFLAPEKHKDVPLLAVAGVLHWIGYTGDALKLAYLAYQKRPDFPVNLYHIGLIHADLGEYEQSIYMFRKALSLDKNFTVAKTNLQNILCLLLFGNEGTITQNQRIKVEEIYQ